MAQVKKDKGRGKKVKIVLIPPRSRGKIDPKIIRAAVKKVREERLKALAGA
ncbi:MAG TPA: hypothetical protein VFG68_11915 [Fimbriiglobus sp.]|nr:hypothetical protein [Fimbriiglobus sp.]